jgi:hypothetical protein
MPSRTLGVELQILMDSAETNARSTGDTATSFSLALYDLQDRLVHQIRQEHKPQYPIPVLETDAMFEPLSHLLFNANGEALPAPKSFSPYLPAWTKFSKWLDAEELHVGVTRQVLPFRFMGSRNVVLVLTFLPKMYEIAPSGTRAK